jgi:hypothetical protein
MTIKKLMAHEHIQIQFNVKDSFKNKAQLVGNVKQQRNLLLVED